MSIFSSVSFIFFVRGKYLVISAKYFLFQAKSIVDTAYKNCFWLWNLTLMWQTEKLFHSFWLSGRRLCKHYQKNKNKNPAYFLHLSSKLEDYLLDFSFQRELHCYLVNHASSHMLVSKIKSCMSAYKHLYCETANGSLNQLSFIWLYLLFDGYLW